MGDIRLKAPRMRALREGHDPLEVQVTNADLVQWDITRARQKWPMHTEAPFLAQTFLTWHAARRIGAIPADVKWEAFLPTVLECAELDDDDTDDAGEDETGRPTLPGPGPG